MKIAHAQLHMYTNMFKFQSSKCKTVGEKLRTKLCPRTGRRTDRQTDGQPWRFQYTPHPLRCWGIKIWRLCQISELELVQALQAISSVQLPLKKLSTFLGIHNFFF